MRGCLHEVQDESSLPHELGDGDPPPPSPESLDENPSLREVVDEALSLRDAMDGNPWRREREHEDPSVQEPEDASPSAHGRACRNLSLRNPRDEIPSNARTEGGEEPARVYETGTPMSPERENPEVVQLGSGGSCFPEQKREKPSSVDEPELGNPPIDEHADAGSPIGGPESKPPSKHGHLELAEHMMHGLRGVIGGAIEAVTECPPGAVLGLLGLEW